MKHKLFLLVFLAFIPSFVFPLEKHLKVNANEGYNLAQERTIENEHYCYTLSKPLDKSPDTFEAWIKIPSELKDSDYGGIIMGNYYSSSGYSHSTNWEITKNGKFRLYWNQLDRSANAEVDYTFNNYDFRNDQWTHVAVIRNPKEGSFSYYINGNLNEKIYRASSDAICKMKPNIGIDSLGWLKNTNGNDFLKTPFKGEIRQIAIYNKAISERKINEDMNSEFICPDFNNDLIGSWTFDDWSRDCVSDYSSYSNDAYIANFEKYIDYEETELYDYTIIGVPDIQITVHYYPETMDLDFDWIANSLKTKNTKYVTFVGDLCDNATVESQWDVVTRGFKKLDNTGVNYGFVPGNHDYDDGGGRSSSLNLFNSHLPYSYYSQKEYFGGSAAPNRIDNYYNLVQIDGIDYCFINLEFGPRDCILEWANRVCEMYPNHRIVVTTHHYLEPAGTVNDSSDYYAASRYKSDVNDGDQVFKKFISKHSNMFMVFSGHTSYDDIVYRRDIGIHGNYIHNILIDAQGSLIATPYSFCDVLSLFKINEAEKKAYVYWYSPLHDKYLNIQNQFEFSFADENNPAIGLAERNFVINVSYLAEDFDFVNEYRYKEEND
ncbi:MAG: hypothetical protein MJ227_01280 [Bacilli bacterium]|nr:hypothetical protein [Bacilli bacterium]